MHKTGHIYSTRIQSPGTIFRPLQHNPFMLCYFRVKQFLIEIRKKFHNCTYDSIRKGHLREFFN